MIWTMKNKCLTVQSDEAVLLDKVYDAIYWILKVAITACDVPIPLPKKIAAVRRAKQQIIYILGNLNPILDIRFECDGAMASGTE